MALFLKTRRVAAILDEAHKIKNPEAEITQALHRLAPSFVRRIIMTGTPVANRPFDLWAQVYFLDQGASLGSDFATFKERLDLTNDLWQNDRKRERFESELTQVFGRISAFTVRKTKATAGIALPEKHIENVAVTLAPRQQELYNQIRNELSASVVADDKLVVDDAEEVLKRLLRLVQIASNPRLIDESYVERPGKLGPLNELVSAAVTGGSKTIVWTSFVANVNWLVDQLSSYGAVKVHGSLPIEERNAAVAAFKNDPRARVLVATPGAAKEGLTLTVANHAIFYDRSFSLDDYLQAQDRIHRISQCQPCYIWNLVGAGTVDEWVDSLLTAKRLAAQLAQADVGREEYSRLADYDFGRVVREVLGCEH
jgi:SNF2 family DNA or RNA helicase